MKLTRRGEIVVGYLSAPKVYPQAIALPKLCELFWIPAWLGQWMSNVFRLDIAIAFAERCKHFFSCSGIGGLRKRPFLAHAVCWWFNSKDTQFVLVNASFAKCVNKCVDNILSMVVATSFFSTDAYLCLEDHAVRAKHVHNMELFHIQICSMNVPK